MHILVTLYTCRVSHSGRGHGGHLPPIQRFFPNPPSKPPMGYPSYLKMKPLHLKNNPPLKREAPFHEMIPRKSTINNNLKSS